MKAYEFNSKISPEGKLECPQDILEKLSPSEEVKVILIVNEDSSREKIEKDNWLQLAAEQFFADSSEEDEIYNQNPSR